MPKAKAISALAPYDAVAANRIVSTGSGPRGIAAIHQRTVAQKDSMFIGAISKITSGAVQKRMPAMFFNFTIIRSDKLEGGIGGALVFNAISTSATQAVNQLR
ncbi:MAG: hypothetical protein GX804_11875 [Lentisphaerae bacterium]|nr:hypothetical protein [Lentisphaerota bacterium]